MSKQQTDNGAGDQRALSFTQAVKAGFNPSDYFVLEGAEFPQGEFLATLDFKVWTKKGDGIGCYFTLKGGQKIVLTAFLAVPKLIEGVVSRYNDWYAAHDCVVDMSRPDVGRPGRRFQIEIGATATNRPKWLRCEPVAPKKIKRAVKPRASSSVELPLSARTHNLLVGMVSRSHLKGEAISPEIIARFNKYEIRRLVGMGEKSFREVARWLKRHDLDFSSATQDQA